MAVLYFNFLCLTLPRDFKTQPPTFCSYSHNHLRDSIGGINILGSRSYVIRCLDLAMATTTSKTVQSLAISQAASQNEGMPSVCLTLSFWLKTHVSTSLWHLPFSADSSSAPANVSSSRRRHEKSSALQDMHQTPLRALHTRMWSYILLLGQSSKPWENFKS